MKIAIIGSGNIGGGLARAWRRAGHDITFGARDPRDAELTALCSEIGARATSVGESVQGADVVALAMPWGALASVIDAVGELAGVTVIDCTNAVKRDADGMTLEYGHTTSSGEQLAAKLPKAHIVRSFNAQGAENLANPVYGGVAACRRSRPIKRRHPPPSIVRCSAGPDKSRVKFRRVGAGTPGACALASWRTTMIEMLMSPDAEMMLQAAGQPLRRLKRAEFVTLAEQGFFEDEQVELLFGLVVPMSPPKQPHVEVVFIIHAALMRRFGDRAKVYCQSAFAASDESVPQPDVFVTPPGQHWKSLHERSLLVVEVSDSSVRRDRMKRVIYSRASVDEYWIVNIVDRCVEVYRDQHEGAWQTTSVHRVGEVITPLAFPDVQIAVADILPPE